MKKKVGLYFNYNKSEIKALHYGLRDLYKIDELGTSDNPLSPQLDTEIYNIGYNGEPIITAAKTVKELIEFLKSSKDFEKEFEPHTRPIGNRKAFRKQLYSITEYINIPEPDWNMFGEAFIELDGDTIKLDKDTFLLYKKSQDCCCCGLKGKFFAKEKSKGKCYHLSLYGILDGREILLTKDHIIPKSLEGPNSLENYQTMCVECNTIKSNDYIDFSDLREKVTDYRNKLVI